MSRGHDYSRDQVLSNNDTDVYCIFNKDGNYRATKLSSLRGLGFFFLLFHLFYNFKWLTFGFHCKQLKLINLCTSSIISSFRSSVIPKSMVSLCDSFTREDANNSCPWNENFIFGITGCLLRSWNMDITRQIPILPATEVNKPTTF